MLAPSVIVLWANAVLAPGPPIRKLDLTFSPKKCYIQQFVVSVEFTEFSGDFKNNHFSLSTVFHSTAPKAFLKAKYGYFFS